MNDLRSRSNALPSSSAPQARTAAKTGQAIQAAPRRDDIARRAYEIFVNRGRRHGEDRQDWLQAERELRK